jgi:CBS domain-containing protein
VRPARAPIRASASIRDAVTVPSEQAALVLSVVDDRNRYAGVVTRAQLDRIAESQRSKMQVQSLLPSSIDRLGPEQTLDDALQHLADSAVPWLPVVVGERIVGGLGVRDAVGTYKNTLPKNARRTRALPEDASLFDVKLRATSPVIGRTLRGAGLPCNVLVVGIRREGPTVFPSADTRLESGDVLTVVAEPAQETTLEAFFDPPVTSV